MSKYVTDLELENLEKNNKADEAGDIELIETTELSMLKGEVEMRELSPLNTGKDHLQEVLTEN